MRWREWGSALLAHVGVARRFLGRHWLMSLLFTAGLGLRVLTIVAYRPAIIYIDSITVYLNHLPGSRLAWAATPTPDPLGYDIALLRPLLAVGNLATIVLVQHALGLAMALVIYVVLRRHGTPRWLAAFATAPVLLDAYQLEIEHTIMSDTLFEALLVAVFATLTWRRRPTWPAIVAAGLLLGAASTVRIVGAPLLALLCVYVVIRLPGWRRRLCAVVALCAVFAIPLAAYQSYVKSQPSYFAAANLRSNTLYARVASFVDCTTLTLPADERELCPREPLGSRRSPDFYAHDPSSPLFRLVVPPTTTLNNLATDFSVRAIRAQPLDLLGAVGTDAAKMFSWNHNNLANPDAPAERLRFQFTFPIYPYGVTLNTVRRVSDEYGGGPPRYSPLPAAILRLYQLGVGFTPGPALAVAMLIALAAAFGLGRARGSPARLPAALYLAAGALVLLVSDAYEFTWRYQLPGLVFLPVAGALGITALTWRPKPAPFPVADDVAAIGAFDRDYGDVAFPPVVVVIAAFQEAAGIGSVLDRLPAVTVDTSGGRPLELATIVVADGGTDDTAAVAGNHGAFTAVLPRNRGQGAALRLGYYLARRGGAAYIVTTDADGQYDTAQLPRLLTPLRDDVADFVTGSRRLGVDESRDQIRRTGVWFFATLVRLLTGFRVTDTSFGLRAMRADVSGALTLDQPQYQSAELLIGVLMRGFAVVEVPATMHTRRDGKSKKGNNLVYGWRYARVVFSTWAREVELRGLRSRGVNTNRSSTRNLAMNMTANAPK